LLGNLKKGALIIMGINGKYDVVVAGAGHNGLITACYLAQAGLDVCVVERHDKVGGGVCTREVNVPGFKHDIASTHHVFIQANPIVLHDELGLFSKYSFKYIDVDPQFIINLKDQARRGGQ
jgi:phytoene dehydrogenase-like protein